MIKQTACRDSLGEFAPKFADEISKESEHGGLFGQGEPNIAYK